MKLISVVNWRAKRLLGAVGWAGVLALFLIAAGIAAYFLVLTPLRQQITDVRAEAQQLKKSAKMRVAEVRTLNPAEQLGDFYKFFPTQDAVPDGMEKIYAAAQMQGVSLERGDYQLAEERDSKLMRYDIAFPVKGGYLQIRKFIAQVLNDVPNASLDSIVFTRQRINDPLVDAQLKFALYLRPLP